MTSGDIIYDKTHSGHESRWGGRLGPAQGGGMLLCVTCVIDMMESCHVASVRKCVTLTRISWVLRCCPGALKELLQQDHSVSLHLTASVLRMLRTVEDPATLEKVIQVLVELLLELQNEQNILYVLDEIHTQLSAHFSVREFLPTFNFLGRLVEAVPNLTQTLVAQYVPMLECLCLALLYPDAGVKASILYLWQRLFETAGGLAAQSIPITIRDKVCILLLQTLAIAGSPQLIFNCLGLLRQLLQLEEAASVLMNSPYNQIMCNTDQSLHNNNDQSPSQNKEPQSSDHRPLPLILKKLLLSGEEVVQVASVQCIESVLTHSPSQYSSPFILADVPEFLFECLASSRSEVLLWSVYSCLLLLTEDPLFFSQCHAVYGIESLVRSVKEALQLANLEVQKQGLLLLTVILDRQPPDVHLFPSGPGFAAVSEAVVAGVSASCLLVATQASNAASALLRLNHQPNPVQYREIEVLLEAVANRCSQLPQHSSAHQRSIGSLKRSHHNSQASMAKGFLLHALLCFQAACRLAEQCASEPLLKENAFTSLSKHGLAQDSVESLCWCVLHCCDAVCIPTVFRICERDSSAEILQCFYCILSSQFTLVPSHMPIFASKLASSGFYRLALEDKALLCAGNRNPNLNSSCCGFLQKLSMCLLYHSDPATCFYKHDAEVENLLQCSLPSLCYRVSDWPSLLCEDPGLYLCDYSTPRATQYCVVIMLHLALHNGDRLLPEQTVFASIVWLLRSVQDHGECPLPQPVLRSALYLLSVTQEKCPDLEQAPLNCICKALSSCQNFSSLYIHHPPLLHFIFRYPELVERFGSLVLELWLTKHIQHKEEEQTLATQDKGEKRESLAEEKLNQEADSEAMEILTLREKYPAVILTLLNMVYKREAPLAERALGVLEVFLRDQRSYEADLCAQLKPALLWAVQRLNAEHSHELGQGHNAEVVNPLPLVLKLLWVMQANDPLSYSSDDSDVDGLHFKLLYHVSNIAGKLKPTDTESLLPAFNYLYCCLSQSPAHCTDRAITSLLSNCGLMEQLQTVLSSSSSSMPSVVPSPRPPSALVCCCHLLLSSLITLQRIHSAQVHKNISWSLDRALQGLLFQKRNTDSLLLVSSLKMLQALLDVDLVSAVLCVTTSSSMVGPRPLEVPDGALYPLGSRGAHRLTAALCGLIMKKHELILRASVNCLASLLSFLHRRHPITAQHIMCQPWNRFLLYSLLSSGEGCLLHPATLTLVTLLLWQDNAVVLWETELLQLMEAVERRGVKELSQETSQALRQLLTQLWDNKKIQSGVVQPPPSQELWCRMKKILLSLNSQQSTESFSHSLPNNILCVGDMSICLSDFTVKAAGGFSGRPIHMF
ncbi:meiosis inhibitor protein 1 [Genypterus blacodes]|uniref:meiosis inhibitor protein 1 n=1 Tax=Genypterus blacodes TaxID=154954 RepID=UPI003F771ABE